MMAGYWERALAPWWDQVRALLEADIRHRAGRLADGGALELFAGLHAGVRWRAGTLEVEATPTPRSSSTGAGCSSCRPCSCGRAPARCSTRRGSRA